MIILKIETKSGVFEIDLSHFGHLPVRVMSLPVRSRSYVIMSLVTKHECHGIIESK